MKKNTISRTVLEADEGYMLTNGEHFAKKVFLSQNENETAWYEISEAEYEEKNREAQAVDE